MASCIRMVCVENRDRWKIQKVWKNTVWVLYTFYYIHIFPIWRISWLSSLFSHDWGAKLSIAKGILSSQRLQIVSSLLIILSPLLFILQPFCCLRLFVLDHPSITLEHWWLLKHNLTFREAQDTNTSSRLFSDAHLQTWTLLLLLVHPTWVIPPLIDFRGI